MPLHHHALTDVPSPLIVLEYMSFGDLRRFLIVRE